MGEDQAERRKRRYSRAARLARHGVGEAQAAKPPPAPPATLAAVTQRKPTRASGMPASTAARPAGADLYDDYDVPEELEDKTDIICVRRDGQIIAMVDNNKMKWETALSALIRDGHVKLTPKQEQLVQMEIRLRGHPSWFHMRPALVSELKQWTDAGNPVLKAAKAKSGEGKTTSITASRIQSLSARLGRDEVTIPRGSAESSKLERSLSAEYKSRKENGTLPATDRQIAFAKELAQRCGIAVPAEVLTSSKATGDFIDHYLLVAPPSERQLQRARQVAGNRPIPDEALKSTKACGDWIERTEHANLDALLAKHRGGKLAP